MTVGFMSTWLFKEYPEVSNCPKENNSAIMQVHSLWILKRIGV